MGAHLVKVHLACTLIICLLQVHSGREREDRQTKVQRFVPEGCFELVLIFSTEFVVLDATVGLEKPKGWNSTTCDVRQGPESGMMCSRIPFHWATAPRAVGRACWGSSLCWQEGVWLVDRYGAITECQAVGLALYVPWIAPAHSLNALWDLIWTGIFSLDPHLKLLPSISVTFHFPLPALLLVTSQLISNIFH